MDNSKQIVEDNKQKKITIESELKPFKELKINETENTLTGIYASTFSNFLKRLDGCSTSFNQDEDNRKIFIKNTLTKQTFGKQRIEMRKKEIRRERKKKLDLMKLCNNLDSSDEEIIYRPNYIISKNISEQNISQNNTPSIQYISHSSQIVSSFRTNASKSKPRIRRAKRRLNLVPSRDSRSESDDYPSSVTSFDSETEDKQP